MALSNMASYRMDDLGWQQFEELVQTVLKIEFGFAVEAWGGTHDGGRDAYHPGPLPFLDKSSRQIGPFIFQCKFVEGANASGARPAIAVKKAVQSELRKMPLKGTSVNQPIYYSLFTNASLSAATRDEVTGQIKKTLPKASVHLFGGQDIEAFLNANSEICKRFPQMLGLRDLKILLQNAVNQDVLEASSEAIAEAADLVPVFVPTREYDRARVVLNDHHFVILSGPPEMGKTSIAWMIALTEIHAGRQAILCRSPDDFFRFPDSSTPKIFVADDAFGRTEYNPSYGASWEHQLRLILRRLSPNNWLIWTCRKHILEHALGQLDFDLRGKGFSKINEVIVRADSLTRLDRARILYRHAKAAHLTVEQKTFVKEKCVSIIQSDHFTPERVKRLVQQLSRNQTLDKEVVLKLIHDGLRNPTDRMRLSFTKLSKEHKWLLLATLEVGDHPTRHDIRTLLKERHRVSDGQIDKLIDDLTDTFIKTSVSLF